MHPILAVQAALVAALKNVVALVAMVGDGIFDAPPQGRAAPYVVIARHDVIQRDADLAVMQEHRVLVHCWGDQPSRKAALGLAERVIAVALGLGGVSQAEHVRTDSVIDGASGLARAAVTLRFLSES